MVRKKNVSVLRYDEHIDEIYGYIVTLCDEQKYKEASDAVNSTFIRRSGEDSDDLELYISMRQLESSDEITWSKGMIKILEARNRVLYNIEHNLRNRIDEIYMTRLREGFKFSNYKWEAGIGRNNGIYLSVNNNDNRDCEKLLCDIEGYYPTTSHHYRINLKEGVTIIVNDYDVEINVSAEELTKLKNSGVEIEFKKLNKDIEDAKKHLEGLQSIKSKFSA